MSNSATHPLVFTDLDGSLLDHHDYSFEPALPRLQQLEQFAVPVIFVSSKTRAEIAPLRQMLANAHPFIVENGAAAYIPIDYFPRQPDGTCLRDGYWVREFSLPRSKWLRLLEGLEPDFSDEFVSFDSAGVAGIRRMTGLDSISAARANQRDYSEAVQWLGTEVRRAEFIQALRAGGATVLQGGRFLSVAGSCDKGRALTWLRQVFEQHYGEPCQDLAVGDSGNDLAMLEVAAMALLVRSPEHDFPAIQRREGLLYSDDFGPSGWASGVGHWLQLLGITN